MFGSKDQPASTIRRMSHLALLPLLLSLTAAAPRSAPPSSAPTAPFAPGWNLERVGLGLDFFLESSRLNGEQWINTTRRDESFDYPSAGLISGTVSLMFGRGGRLRIGPGLRLYGNYAAGDNRDFLFGVLSELFALAEYGIPAIEKVQVVLGGRAGAGLLFPAGDFGDEIRRLQRQGLGVWSIPRVGWLAGVNAGARRPLGDRLSVRLDVLAQMSQLFLFATDQVVFDLRVRKGWSTYSMRYGLTLGLELAL
jgi:hypothetical protein